MRTRVKDTKKEVLPTRVAVKERPTRVAVKEECHHFWLIDSASGPTSRGHCKVCGATKEFFNAIPEPETVVKRHVPFHQMPELQLANEGESGPSSS